jgi:hypothetical protein
MNTNDKTQVQKNIDVTSTPATPPTGPIKDSQAKDAHDAAVKGEPVPSAIGE